MLHAACCRSVCKCTWIMGISALTPPLLVQQSWMLRIFQLLFTVADIDDDGLEEGGVNEGEEYNAALFPVEQREANDTEMCESVSPDPDYHHGMCNEKFQ